MGTLNLAPQLANMSPAEQAICGLKHRSIACLLLYYRNGTYRATGADAAEIAFCTQIPLSYRKQGYESNFPDHAVTVAAHQIERVIAHLLKRGNPVALVDEETGEVREWWPEQSSSPVEGYWLALPFRSAATPPESVTNTETFAPYLVDAELTPDSCFPLPQRGTNLGDFKDQLTPIEVPF